MATTPTLPLFDEPATPSAKRWPDDNRTCSEGEPEPSYGITVAGNRGGAGYVPEVPEEERIAHVDRLEAAGELTFDPIADLNRGWWETLNESTAQELLARYKREAKQAQSLAANLDQFDELDTYDFDSDGFVAPADDGW